MGSSDQSIGAQPGWSKSGVQQPKFAARIRLTLDHGRE
jgi:hypothetical protein